MFWDGAVVTATYVRNRCPSTALGMKTPEEVWSRHPLNLDRLRIFCCLSYGHIRQDRLEPKVMRCMFHGYLEGVKPYRLWCLEPGHKRCIIIRDVVVNKAEMTFKKTDDIGQSTKISVEELEHEDISVEVEHSDYELHNSYEVKDEAQVVDEDKETINDYLLARDMSRRVIKPPHRLGYANLIAFVLISTSEVLNEEPKDYKESVRTRNKIEWLTTMDDEMKSLHNNNTS